MSLPKPRTKFHRPDLTRLPDHTWARCVFRWLMRGLGRLVLCLATRSHIYGLENLPAQGPAIIITNHLGDADVVMGMAYFPTNVDAFAAIDLHFKYPPLAVIGNAYGVIWVHRGVPDRNALRVGLDALQKDRIIAIAPEGRESLTGTLEAGTSGAAFLALRSGAPLFPVTFTGTSNKVIFSNLRRLRRSRVSMTAGPSFQLMESGKGRQALESATDQIMLALARQLPEELRGEYSSFQPETKEAEDL